VRAPMGERRTGEIPIPNLATAPAKERRRGGERRDSPRVAMHFLVRDVAEGGSYEEHEGDLSVGGIYWKTRHSPEGGHVEVRFRLPRVPREVRAKGEIIRIDEGGGPVGVHVRFTELDVESELAIARFLEST
jgi:uncharacterized protein (TIGR02266 family)